MFERSSKQYFPLVDPALLPAVHHALGQHTGLELRPVAPNRWTARTQNTRYLCYYELTLTYVPTYQGGATIELRGDVKPDAGAIVVLVIASTICLLPGVILLLLVYLDFSSWAEGAIRAGLVPAGRTP